MPRLRNSARIRSGPYTATIGRLDQHLYPFYRRDIDAGVVTRDGAMDLLCQLWDLYNCGITLTNIMIGGHPSTNARGRLRESSRSIGAVETLDHPAVRNRLATGALKRLA